MKVTTAMGKWWLAASSWQCAHSCHMTCLMQNVLAKHQITQVTQPPYSPDLVPWDFWLFPKLKPPLKGKRFQTITEIQGSWWWLGELCEVPQCLLWRGLRHHCPRYNVSCILYLLQQMSLFLYPTMAGYFPNRPHRCCFLSNIYLQIPCLFWVWKSKFQRPTHLEYTSRTSN